MVDDMIERVARKILEAQTDWLFGKDAKEDLFLTMARAAIEAMREPTGEMFETAAYYLGGSDRVRKVWYDLIDAMLEESDE